MATRNKKRRAVQAADSAASRRAAPANAGVVSDRTLNVVAALLLAGAVLAIYARVLPKPFIYDDAGSIANNKSIMRLWPLWGSAEQRGPLQPPEQRPTAGRPLVNLSFALNYWLGGLNPGGYRAVNVAMHFVSAYLLMLIVRRTLRLGSFGGRFDSASGPLAVMVALVWAVHPLNTEAVAYVTQRTELLMGLCYLATLYFALRYWAASTRGTRAAWLTLAVIACAAGMASKEVMVSAPLVVLLFDWTFLRRSVNRMWRESWPLYLGLAATWGLLVALNIGGPRSESAGFHLDMSPYVWWATQCRVLWLYFGLAVWPWPLAIHYELPYLRTWTAAWPWVLLTAAFVVGSVALVWRRHPAGFIGAAVLAILSPTLVVPILSEVAAERRMYLPLAAIVAGVVIGTYSAVRWLWRWRSTHLAEDGRLLLAVVATGALFLVVAASLVSAHRLTAYQNVMTLWQDVVRHQPDNFIANHNLGSCLLAVNRPQDAIGYFERAARLRPEYFPTYAKLAGAYVDANQPTRAMAIAQQAVKLAESAGQKEAAMQIREWLSKYRANEAAAANSGPATAPSVE